MDRPPSALSTKLGQAPTSSPRTTEKRRRNLGSLFSSLALKSVSPVIVAPAERSDEEDDQRRATSSSVRLRSSQLSASGHATMTAHDEDEGCYMDGGSQQNSGVTTVDRIEDPSGTKRSCPLLDLPDEL